jgi:hypothetical protein
MNQDVIRRFPGTTGGARRKRKLRTFVVYKSPLFNDLVSSLLQASDEVRVVGRCDNVRDAARSIGESDAEVVLVEGSPADVNDLSLLTYLIVTAAEAAWTDMVVFSVDGSAFTSVHRGTFKRLDAKKLLSFVGAG